MGWWPWPKKQQEKRQPAFMAGQEEYVFRRSRTLTGTTSEKVVASAENRGLLKTERLKLHELKQYRLKTLKAIGAIGAVMGVITFLASVYIASPPLDTPESNGKQPNIDAYARTVQDYFASRPLERFGFVANPTTIQDYILRHHSEVKQALVSRNWFGGDFRLAIYFREPIITWEAAGKKYYVDSQGYAFEYNHFAEPEVSVKDESGISPEVSGGSVASSRFISFLGRMVGALNGYGKGKVEAIILPASTREVDVKLQGRSSLIKTHIDRDPLEQAEDIANALTYFDSKEVKPEYIDVRVAGKAFYR